MDSKKMTETLLDAAACEALGVSSPADSAAYQQELAAAGDDARRVDRELRETVARLAAASPHLAPPPDLRGKILQATAPVTFKMEDYRKATKEPSRFYKWGFYAAMLFLMAGAYYNLTMQSQVKQMASTMAQRDAVVSTLIDPNCQQVTVKNENGQPYARYYRNEMTKQALVILPESMVPAGKTVQLQMPGGDGKMVAYETALIKAPDAAFASGQGAMKGQSMETVLTLRETAPDMDARHPLESRPKVASQGK